MALHAGKRVVREAGRRRWMGTQGHAASNLSRSGSARTSGMSTSTIRSSILAVSGAFLQGSRSPGQRGISTHWYKYKHDNLVEGRVYGIRKRLVDVESKQDKPHSGGEGSDSGRAGGSGSGGQESGIKSIQGGDGISPWSGFIQEGEAPSHVWELSEDLDDLDWNWDGISPWSDFTQEGEAPSHVWELTDDLDDLDWSWDGISPWSDASFVVSNNEDDLGECIEWKQVECVNENPDHTFVNALKHENWLDDNKYLESDGDDAKLLLKIYFKIHVKLSALMISCPPDKGPKILKLFFNKPNMDLSDVEGATHEVEVSPEHLLGVPIQLDTARFGEVESLQVRFEGNEGTTLQIQKLSIIGSTIPTTRAEDFEPQCPNAHVQTQSGDSIK